MKIQFKKLVIHQTTIERKIARNSFQKPSRAPKIGISLDHDKTQNNFFLMKMKKIGQHKIARNSFQEGPRAPKIGISLDHD